MNRKSLLSIYDYHFVLIIKFINHNKETKIAMKNTAEKTDKNNYISKLKRSLTSLFLPVDKNRKGKCISCGECCKLPNICPFLVYNKKGKSSCSVYKIRPPSCRKYPRAESEHITKESCGYKFVKP